MYICCNQKKSNTKVCNQFCMIMYIVILQIKASLKIVMIENKDVVHFKILIAQAVFVELWRIV